MLNKCNDFPWLGTSLGGRFSSAFGWGDPKPGGLAAGLGAALPGGVANSKVGEGLKPWVFPLWGCKLYSWVMMGTLGDSSVGPWDLLQLCPAGALDGRFSEASLASAGCNKLLVGVLQQTCFHPRPMVIFQSGNAEITWSSKQLLFTCW